MIELITTISIIAIIAVLAAPGFGYLVNKRRADSTINNIFRNFELARNTAINQGSSVTLCASNNRQTCNADGGEYFISFLDPDQDAVIDASKNINTQIIRNTKSGKQNTLIKINNFSGIKGTLQIQADGMTRGSIQTGSIAYCPKEDLEKFGRLIAVSRTGRARIRNQDEYDGLTTTGKATDSEPNIVTICN